MTSSCLFSLASSTRDPVPQRTAPEVNRLVRPKVGGLQLFEMRRTSRRKVQVTDGTRAAFSGAGLSFSDLVSCATGSSFWHHISMVLYPRQSVYRICFFVTVVFAFVVAPSSNMASFVYFPSHPVQQIINLINGRAASRKIRFPIGSYSFVCTEYAAGVSTESTISLVLYHDFGTVR